MSNLPCLHACERVSVNVYSSSPRKYQSNTKQIELTKELLANALVLVSCISGSVLQRNLTFAQIVDDLGRDRDKVAR